MRGCAALPQVTLGSERGTRILTGGAGRHDVSSGVAVGGVAIAGVAVDGVAIAGVAVDGVAVAGSAAAGGAGCGTASSSAPSSRISPVAVFTANAAGVRDANAAATVSAVRRPMPGTSQSSSTVAARSFFSEPKCFSSAWRRVSPRPGTESSSPAVSRLDRLLRWYEMAKRCASSRTRWSRYRPSLLRGRTTGSSSPGSQTSSSRLARPQSATSSMPSSSSARRAAATCGRPPSTTSSCGG